MNAVSALAVLGFIVIVVLAYRFIARSQKRADEHKSQVAAALGFAPVKEPDAEFIRRVEFLYQHPGGATHLKLSNTAYKTFPDGQMILFDLWEASGDDVSQETEQALAIVSPYLHLPKFCLRPRLPEEGRVAEFTNRLIQWIVSQGGQRLDFSAYPDFDRRYFVSGETAALAFLTPDLLNRLVSLPAINLNAGGDMFTFSYPKYASPAQPGDPSAASQQISLAMALFTWLSASRVPGSL